MDNPNYKGSYTSISDVFKSCLAKTNGVTANSKPATIPTKTTETKGELYVEIIPTDDRFTVSCFKKHGQYLLSESLYVSLEAARIAAREFLRIYSDESGSIDLVWAFAAVVPVAYFVRAIRNAFGK